MPDELGPDYDSPDIDEFDPWDGAAPLDVPESPGPYQEIRLPDFAFVIMDDSGVAAGPFRAGDFSRDEDTGTYFVTTQGRPIFLRVVDSFDDDTDLRCVDGGGQLWRYRIVPA